MKALDASSAIHAWDNYPVKQFPALWNWLQALIDANELCISVVAMGEVADRSPECAKWLRQAGIKLCAVTAIVSRKALELKSALGIVEEDYHAKGVDENDLLIIAGALVDGAQLISNEGKQAIVPKERRKFKIPAVCGLPEVKLECLDFITFLRRSDQVF